MKANFLPAIMTTCCAAFAFSGFSQQMQPRIRKNEEIIIHKSPSDSGKTIIEIDSNVVTVNGKPLSDYNGDVTITRRRNFMGGANGNDFFGHSQPFMFHENPQGAFLGVYSSKGDDGVIVNSVLDNSSAKNAGLQKGDIITKVDDKEIRSPEDLRSAIQAYKPGDHVMVNYLRDGRQKSVKVELGKAPSSDSQAFANPPDDMMNGFGNGGDYQFRMMPMPPQNFNFNFDNNRPQLGLQIQDMENNSGVKVQEVVPGSPADKAGIKQGDIITELNGKKVTDVDRVMSELHGTDHSRNIKIKAMRGKKEMDFDVHMPHPLRTTNI